MSLNMIYAPGDYFIVFLDRKKKNLVSSDKIYVRVIGPPEELYAVPLLLDDPVPVPLFLLDYLNAAWLSKIDEENEARFTEWMREKGFNYVQAMWQKVLDVWADTSRALAYWEH